MLNINSSEPLVSVIIPTYNRPEYLKQAINSAVKQTYQNLEIIVSDNCSSENPQALIESFPDSRIKFWRHKENLGIDRKRTRLNFSALVSSYDVFGLKKKIRIL